ncbi:Oidioi.mRNA.OKI2018_I69.PAR.g12876.t1.cds [Oikopleura dioica]|uniref:Mannosyl-oligosaccharide glucosidase n=1 Tax=Oikopleura dioica TaxID=34765 RepID=A0ABN7S2P9_OIKDI|nr:Oidioi.mRNA.OKI2018_I69.PAR.g12876.t1.cds [Oikopleura dioica]
MWLNNKFPRNEIQGDIVRHKCNQDNQLKYGWKEHDGVNFGVQSIQEKNYKIWTKFLKQQVGGNGGDWTVKVDTEGSGTTTFAFYFVTDSDGYLKVPLGNDPADELDKFTGETSSLSKFEVRFLHDAQENTAFWTYSDFINKITDLENDVMRRLSGEYIELDENQKVPHFWFDEPKYDKNYRKPNHKNHQVVVHSITCEHPCSFEVNFNSVSGNHERKRPLVGDFFEEELSRHRKNFKRVFGSRIKLQEQFSGEEHLEFAMAAVSNMIGGFGYYYGHSLVQKQGEKVTPNWDAPLYTAVPSRSFFPRGFLWDEGFHQLLVSRFNPKISIDSLCHWLDLLNMDGWIPREQILDEEARQRVPDPFIIQGTDRANPPTLLLALDYLVSSESLEKDQLEALYPRIKAWFSWFNTTQAGPIPGTYTWQGRHIGPENLELNPKTLTSGLDDFPRASHPTKDEYHLDLRCWMALAAQVLGKMAIKLGQSNYEYLQLETELKDNTKLNKLHWDAEAKQFSDYGLHSHNVKLVRKQVKDDHGNPRVIKVRKVVEQPRLRLVPHTGYIQLFPFLMKILDSDSPQLGATLEMIGDPQKLWTDFGLRSLAKSDPMFEERNTEHDPPYWRGNIWININFLAVHALDFYSDEPGPYQTQAADLATRLRQNLIGNVFRNYKETGFIWENYSEKDGKGQGCHPFTGWSALTVLLMEETKL